MKLFKQVFSSSQWDHILSQWKLHRAHPEDLKEIKNILSYDSRFREQFCEWIKALRDIKKS